jgi:hypothetical protein
MSDETTPGPDHLVDGPRWVPRELALDLLARAERAEAELARRAEADERMNELMADHVSEYAQRAADAEEWAGRLYTAWWSARIGRARAREGHRRARAVAQIRGSEVRDLKRRHTELTIETDQLKATVARVKALAEDMRTWCSPHGIAVTYAQRIDEAIEPPAPVKSDLSAVREFVAGFDPRKEAT